ncbi:MAG TPA: zinc-ribbon domain-containing protein [Candidatus Bariatricus faecipullorum]|nr:zinc-ribbon domain-containing protein [Candidatus Bariatricus faecipullorum]
MAFLDELDKKISQFGQGAIQKTKDVSESMRISTAIREEQAKQQALFRKIGEYYYHVMGSQAAGEVLSWCREIDASREQEAALKDKLQVLKGVIICPACGAEIAANSSFCNNCGAKIEQRRPEQPVTGKVCRNCGNPIPEGHLFCTSCGTKVEEDPIPEPVEEPVPQPIPEPVPDPIPEPVEETQRVCRNCGAPLEEGQLFCTQCGTKI